MADVISCPRCNHSLRVPEELRGQPVACPACAGTFQVAAAEGGRPAKTASDRSGTEDRPSLDWEVPQIRRRGQPGPQRAVAGPAIALLVTAIIGLVLLVLTQGFRLYLWASYAGPSGFGPGPKPPEMVILEAVELAQGAAQLASMGIVIWGAWKMWRLESYGLAMSAAILMMLPWASPCCLLGLPFGIWAITVLNRSEVREAFARK